MADTQSITFDVEGMTCASCALRIERVLGKQDGVETAIVNYAGHEARAEVGPDVDVEALRAAVSRIGYEIDPVIAGEERVSVTERYDEEALYQRRNLIGAASLTVPVFLLAMLGPDETWIFALSHSSPPPWSLDSAGSSTRQRGNRSRR